jgi:arylformamidase
MKIIDISLPIHEKMISFPNDPVPKFTTHINRVNRIGFKTTLVNILSHTGTHIDAPSHYFHDGKTIDQIPLELLIGDGCVLSLSNDGSIEADVDIENKIILLKTGEGKNLQKGIFNKKYISPKIDLIRYLIRKNIRALGIDTLSIDAFSDKDSSNHSSLLKANIPIIEGLNLEEVTPGEYFCILMPLNLQGIDGAPGRCVLVQW